MIVETKDSVILAKKSCCRSIDCNMERFRERYFFANITKVRNKLLFKFIQKSRTSHPNLHNKVDTNDRYFFFFRFVFRPEIRSTLHSSERLKIAQYFRAP